MQKYGIILDVLLIYAIITLLVYAFSNGMMFKPPILSYTDNDEIIKLKTKDGKHISAMYFPNKNAKYTILYSHGNASDLGYIKYTMQQYHKHGYSVLAYDYHGYGTSDGITGEKNTYLDVEAAYEFLTTTKKTPPQNIVSIGRSLGSGPTLELASHHKLGAVILESPFYTSFRVRTIIPIFPIDKYRNNRKISKINAPLLIIHGKKDDLIPFWHAQKLYALAKEPKKLFIAEKAAHNDLYEVLNDEYWSVIKTFLSSINNK